ncbi:MAG TPA: type II toxin-antitoxin system RelE/ParE family toxin [Verrucomicrobiota bacterium]|nr:type II toxin-antitoxin system RelE/ParE family toxin [Verrucomicrobiota bacterium]HQL77611.1 type II toxin-antitoxin system RelE/ParE family toxin [Verrucomicrobiota bacterium]
MKRLLYLTPAEVELVEAAEYYDSERQGLGRAFLDAVGAAEKQVQRNPQLWAFRRKPVRSCRVERFPYRLHYVEEPDRIVVVAVVYASRHPEYWKGRLG